MSNGPKHIGIAYGAHHGVRPAILIEERAGRPGGLTIRIAEWNASGARFMASRWVGKHDLRPALPATDPRVVAMLAAYDAAETLAAIEELS